MNNNSKGGSKDPPFLFAQKEFGNRSEFMNEITAPNRKYKIRLNYDDSYDGAYCIIFTSQDFSVFDYLKGKVTKGYEKQKHH